MDKSSKHIDEILRKSPLFNAHGAEFPRMKLKRLEVPHIRLQPLQPNDQIFESWFDECDNLIKDCDAYDAKSAEFDRWYSERYMSSKPPGIINNVLSPSRR